MTGLKVECVNLQQPIDELCDIGRRFYARGWSTGTSSNYSIVTGRDPWELLVTASGMDKGMLSAADFVRINAEGQPVLSAQPKASAETMLHVVLGAEPQIGSVLHTHSVWGTLLSDYFYADGVVQVAGYEMLKGLAGISTHDTQIKLKIFENTQDITALSREVARLRQAGDPSLQYGFLIRRHGLYTWGTHVHEARRHVEILEFLFEVLGRQLSMR
jgi:methylthioribulose-1-phosphate dehydratase